MNINKESSATQDAQDAQDAPTPTQNGINDLIDVVLQKCVYEFLEKVDCNCGDDCGDSSKKGDVTKEDNAFKYCGKRNRVVPVVGAHSDVGDGIVIELVGDDYECSRIFANRFSHVVRVGVGSFFGGDYDGSSDVKCDYDKTSNANLHRISPVGVNISHINMASGEALMVLDGCIPDLVYINNNTDYKNVSSDINNWWKNAGYADGFIGYIGGGSYNSVGVRRAVDEFIRFMNNDLSSKSGGYCPYKGTNGRDMVEIDQLDGDCPILAEDLTDQQLTDLGIDTKLMLFKDNQWLIRI